MRITNSMMINNMLRNIGNNLGRLDKYENQMATGKVINAPSDDPAVAARALKLHTDVAQIEQYSNNTGDAQSWLDMTDSTLSDIGEVLQRVRELAVQGANGSNTPSDTKKIGEEVTQLKSQLVNLSNATYAGRYIFSGYKTDEKLMNDDGTFAISVDNSEDIRFEIGIGDSINVNVPAGELFDTVNPTVAGTSGKLMTDINDLLTALNAGNTTAVGTSIQSIEDNIDSLLRARADVGARSNRVELTSNRLQNDNTNFTKLLSQNEDVDLAETIMNLQNEENVYKASLSGGAKIIQPTLVDFLR